jgi:hypothetical protein
VTNLPIGIKTTLLPFYYRLLRILRGVGLLRQPSIRICVSTTKSYASTTVPLLLESLLSSGVKAEDIYIYEGGHHKRTRGTLGPNHFLVSHNSFDFTALIEVSEIESKNDYWFLIHDTCLVSKDFASLISNIPHFLPSVMPVKNYPAMNIGLYKHAFLRSMQETLAALRNKEDAAEAIQQAKERAVQSEDLVFKKCKRPYVYNPWLLRDDEDYKVGHVSIPPIYKNRICEYFPQTGIFKFKANYSFRDSYQVNL